MPFKKRNMKQTLKENGGLPASILWTLSIVAGITVANLYYNQPLLNMIRQDLHVSEVITNLIAMVTQIGYAMGLLFVIPLGDMFQRKKIIIINFSTTLWHWSKKNYLKPVKVGNKVRYRQSDIQKILGGHNPLI